MADLADSDDAAAADGDNERSVKDFPVQGFPFTRDFPLQGISPYKGLSRIWDFTLLHHL